jgi:hypothetical protein
MTYCVPHCQLLPCRTCLLTLHLGAGQLAHPSEQQHCSTSSKQPWQQQWLGVCGPLWGPWVDCNRDRWACQGLAWAQCLSSSSRCLLI